MSCLGKYAEGKDKSHIGDLSLDLHTPNKKLSQLKLTSSIYVDSQHKDKGELKGSAGIVLVGEVSHDKRELLILKYIFYLFFFRFTD